MTQEMSKITQEHINLVSKIIRVYGFKNLLDSETKTSAQTLEEDDTFLPNINK